LPLEINGKSYFIKENFFPIKDEKGDVKNVMLVGQDISQLQNQKHEIESLNDELTDKIKEIEKQNILLLSQRKEIEAINKEIKQHNKEIRNINASLEKRVRKRTKNLEEKNKQLAEYAYINSHLLRGPLCSILGLVNLMESNPKKDHELILMHMKKSSNELHEVVKKITEAIEDGSHFDRELLSQN
jgi:signal transduction histidine kinase